LLKDELKNTNPSLALIVAIRKAAFGNESLEKTELNAGRMVTQELPIDTGERSISALPIAAESELLIEGDERTLDAQAGGRDESELLLSDDTAMSIWDSDEEDTGSNGFSRGVASSSCGESVVSPGSRKRPADESPEREPAETTRKEFPGSVTRSDAGCRINVPPVIIEEAKGTVAQAVAPACEAVERGVPITTTETIAQAIVSQVKAVAENVAPTTDAALQASTHVIKSVAERVVNATTIVTSVEGDTTINTVPSKATLTTAETGTTVTCDVASLTLESHVAVLLISTGIVGVLAVSESADTTTVSVTCEITAPFVTSRQMTGPQTTMAGLTIPRQAVAAAQGSNPATVTIASELKIVTAAMPVDIQILSIQQPVMDMVEGIFQIIEGMEPPWITPNVLEVAAVRFLNVDREMLRLTIMTVMMSQRRCVVRLTRAGLRLGPRTDREGNAFIELDLDFADRYSTSH